jgi:hypothetical protein
MVLMKARRNNGERDPWLKPEKKKPNVKKKPSTVLPTWYSARSFDPTYFITLDELFPKMRQPPI